jgi:hypothetical protein
MKAMPMKSQNVHLANFIIVGLTFFGLVKTTDAQTDPCALLTAAEIQQAFPGSRAGRADRPLEAAGMLRCVWDSPDGHLFLVAGGDAAEDTPKDEAETLALGLVNPARVDALRPVRFENLPGVGDTAVAVVERRDEAKGILQDGAILVVRRGKRQVSIMAPAFARRDRSEALRVLGELGKAIARRLS